MVKYMGIMKDVLDVMKDLGNAGTETAEVLFKRKRYSSISKRSLEGTLQFPVIASRSLDVETLQMVSKALERDYASFAQIAMTMSPYFNVKTDKDLSSYLRKFHQNSNVKSGINDIHNTFATIGESYTLLEDESTGSTCMYGIACESNCPTINHTNVKDLDHILEGVLTETLNHKFIPRRSRVLVGGNDSLNRYHNVLEAQGKPGQNINVNVNMKNPESKSNINNGNASGHDNSNSYALPQQVLKDNDAKKANELVPTIMHMRVNTVAETDGKTATIDFLLGIKTTLHPVTSEEMINNMYSGLRSKGKFFNFIRFTTGEIGFFKDFLLGVKDLREDVSSQSTGNSKWWVALKRRRNLAKIGGRLMVPKTMLPNATIVLSYDESEYIKSTYGYDLMNSNTADVLMKEYFLLGFVIVDVSSQISHFLFDGQTDYQSVSFNGLEKSSHGKNDMDFKDVLRLVQRV